MTDEQKKILRQMIRDGEATGLYTIQDFEAKLNHANLALQRIARLHRKETRWTVDYVEDKSWESKEEALEWDEGITEEQLSTFDVCAECSRIEWFASDFNYIGDQSAWPCKTAQILIDHGMES